MVVSVGRSDRRDPEVGVFNPKSWVSHHPPEFNELQFILDRCYGLREDGG